MNDVFVVGDVLLHKQDQQGGWLIGNISEEDLRVVAKSSVDFEKIEQKRRLFLVEGDIKHLEESSLKTIISISQLSKILNKTREMFFAYSLEKIFIIYDIDKTEDKFHVVSISEKTSEKTSEKEKTIFLNFKTLTKEELKLFRKMLTFPETTQQLKEFIRKEFAEEKGLKTRPTKRTGSNCFKCFNSIN